MKSEQFQSYEATDRRPGIRPQNLKHPFLVGVRNYHTGAKARSSVVNVDHSIPEVHTNRKIVRAFKKILTE